MDLNKIIKAIFVKQRENRDLYLELAQKTIFLVSEQDFRKIYLATTSNQFKRSVTVKPPAAAADSEDNFDHLFAKDLVEYGGFPPVVARKTVEKDKIESKTEALVQLCKQMKEGLLDLEEHEEKPKIEQRVES